MTSPALAMPEHGAETPRASSVSCGCGLDVVGILRATLVADPDLTRRLAEHFGLSEPAPKSRINRQ